MDRQDETTEQRNARLDAFERDLQPVPKPKPNVTIPIKPLAIRTVKDGKVSETVLGWQLNRVDDIAWTQDRSGVVVYIAWDLQTSSVRLDIISERNAEPLQSFAGKAENVRKAVMKWLFSNVGIGFGLVNNVGVGPGGISLEHASYIGAELARCDAERIDYMQD